MLRGRGNQTLELILFILSDVIGSQEKNLLIQFLVSPQSLSWRRSSAAGNRTI